MTVTTLSSRACVGGFRLWWFLCLNIAAAESVLPSVSCVSSWWQDPECPGMGYAIWAGVSLAAMTWHTDPELSLCLVGALVGLLSSSDPPELLIRWLVSLYISESQSGQWMSGADVVTQCAQGCLKRVTLCGVSFLHESALSPFGPSSFQQQELPLRRFKSSLIKSEKRAEGTNSCVHWWGKVGFWSQIFLEE